MTTADRRLAAMETSLSPTERVVRWLLDAHAHGSFEAWAQATFAEGPDSLPLGRLAREAQAAARAERRGTSGAMDKAVHNAVLATVFRFQLVLRIIDVTDTALRIEMLACAALSAHVALAFEKTAERPESVTLLATLRDALFGRVAELHALEAARSSVEAAYLGGETTLFPDAMLAWTEQLHHSERMAVMAMRMAELEGAPALDEARYGLTDEARVAICVAELVEPARIKALDELGDGRAAISWAIR